MVILGCALDMVLLWVFAIEYLERMALSLGLGVPGAPKMTMSAANFNI